MEKKKGNLKLKIPLMAPDSSAVLGAKNVSKFTPAQEGLPLHRRFDSFQMFDLAVFA
mgnify:CR=1 FL=1